MTLCKYYCMTHTLVFMDLNSIECNFWLLMLFIWLSLVHALIWMTPKRPAYSRIDIQPQSAYATHLSPTDGFFLRFPS